MVSDLRNVGDVALDVHLPVDQRTEAPCPPQPRRIAAVDALAPAGQEHRILHMEHADVLAVDVDVVEVVELLQHEMADRKSTRLNSSHLVISYAVFCLKKKKKTTYRSHSRISVVETATLECTRSSSTGGQL